MDIEYYQEEKYANLDIHYLNLLKIKISMIKLLKTKLARALFRNGNFDVIPVSRDKEYFDLIKSQIFSTCKP